MPALDPFSCGFFLDKQDVGNIVGCLSERGKKDRVSSLTDRSLTFPVVLLEKINFLFCGTGRIKNSPSVAHPRVMVIPFCGGYTI